ncbi:MAG: DNA recombination protein RmuC [Thermoleophilia bacterium]
MNWIAIVTLIAGFALGVGAAFILKLVKTRTARELADELYRSNEAQRQESLNSVIANMRDSFGNLSLEALAKSNEEFLKLAEARLGSEREIGVQELESRKKLIDQQLEKMTGELSSVQELVKTLEKDRENKFGDLTRHLQQAGEQTAALAKSTNTLNEALSSSQVRGQWGERMAEDVLRMAGFIENINYRKQATVEAGSRPDFTFLMPGELSLNMDVKFPLDNYMRYLQAESDGEKDQYRKAFLRDVKSRVKEVSCRDYINEDTVDSVLLFIPNEQIYAFIHENDSSILDEALKDKVVFCSPITLIAVLAVIRKAIDNFSLEKTSDEILMHLGVFHKQWQEFKNRLALLGKKLGQAQNDFETLATTRTRQLERPLHRIEDLRKQKGLPIADEDGVEEVVIELMAAEEEETGETAEDFSTLRNP